MGQYVKPLLQPTPWSRPFWEGLKRHELLLQKCSACGQLIMYPKKCCPYCLSGEMEWVKASGRGRIYSFTVVKNNPPSLFMRDVPFIIAIIRLEEGVQMLSNILTNDLDSLECELDVEVVFDDVTDGVTLPKFRVVSTV